eukprot:evm.model.NODE_3200_length_18072_cov_20.463037.5
MRCVPQPRASNGKLRCEKNDGAPPSLVHQLKSYISPWDLQEKIQDHQNQRQQWGTAAEVRAIERCPDDVQQYTDGQKDKEQGSQEGLR